MFGFVTNNLMIMGAAVLVALLAVFGLYFWYAQDQIAQLHASVATAQSAIEQQNLTINNMQQVAESQKLAIQSLQTDLNRAETQRAQLAAQVRNLNIVRSAQTNRPQTQTMINNQINQLFDSVRETSNAPR
jgi:uncharacterized protein HemX